jgi:O-antigen ligase
VSGVAQRLGRSASWWLAVIAVLVVVSVAGALTHPLATVAAVLGASVLVSSLRWPLATALAFIVTGPLFLSSFPAGPMTLDNLAVLYGTAVATAWLLTRRWQVTPVAAWPASLALAAAVAAAANGGAGLPGTVRFFSLATLALVLANADREVRRRTVAWTEAAVTLGALVLLAQPFTGYPEAFDTHSEGVGQRFGGLFGHPNFAAYTISLVLLYQVYARRYPAPRVASSAILLLALLMTGSRAALLVFVVLLLPAAWMRSRRFFALLTPALLALPFVGTMIITRLQSISQTGGISGNNASGWRLDQWQDALAATRGHEFFGIGWGQTASVLTDELGAHSSYVEIWLELGRVGTMIAAVGLVVLVWSTRRSLVARILLAYAAITGVSDPVLVYPSCLTVLLVLLCRVIHSAEPAQAPAVHPGATTQTLPGPRPPLRRSEPSDTAPRAVAPTGPRGAVLPPPPAQVPVRRP